MFKCNQCAFQGDYKQNLKRHERNMHGNNTAPTTMYLGDNDPPTTINAHSTQLGSHNIRINEPSMQCESDPAEIFQVNTVPIEKYNKVVGIAQEWKKECKIKDNGIHARNEFLAANNSMDLFYNIYFDMGDTSTRSLSLILNIFHRSFESFPKSGFSLQNTITIFGV